MDKRQDIIRKDMYNGYEDNQYEEERYNATHMKDYLEVRSNLINNAIKQHFTNTENIKILDVGCGTGLNLANLRNSFPKAEIYGIDISSKMLQICNKKFNSMNLYINGISLGSAYELPYPDETFDCLVATRFIHQYSHNDKVTIFNEMKRTLNSGGILLVEFYNRPYHWLRYYLSKDSRSKDKYFSHYPTRNEVRKIISGVFERIPCRLGGSRIIANTIGNNLLKKLTLTFSKKYFNWLYDEYFVLIKK